MGDYATFAADRARCAKQQAARRDGMPILYLNESALALQRACREGEPLREIEEAIAGWVEATLAIYSAQMRRDAIPAQSTRLEFIHD